MEVVTVARYPWERPAMGPLPAERQAWIEKHVTRALENGGMLEWRGLPREHLIARFSLLEARLCGMAGQPLFMSHAWEFRDVTLWYYGHLKGEVLVYDYAVHRFSLPLRFGLIAQSNGDKHSWREWEDGNILPEWMHSAARKKNARLPGTALCVGPLEIAQYLSLADPGEENGFWELAEHFELARAVQ